MNTRAKLMTVSVILLSILITTPALLAQSQRTGVLILAHGGSESWNTEVLKVRQQIDSQVPTEVAFGMAAKRTIQEAADRLSQRGVTNIIAVPLFVSPHSSIVSASEYLLGLRKEAPPQLSLYAKMDHGTGTGGGHADHPPAFDPMTPIRSVPVSMAGALGRHPLVAGILSSRAASISKSPDNEVVIVVAHGPVSDEENVKWLDDMAALADEMRSAKKFNRIDYMTVRDDAPESIRSKAAAELRSKVEQVLQDGKRALIVPLLLSYGGIELGIRKRLEGLDYTMSEHALLPDDRIVKWVLVQAGLAQ
jgi:sirohydrochlorin ferrochelatase